MEIPCLLQAAAADHPNAAALSVRGSEISYDELNRLVSGTARRLAATGLTSGDRVALVLENGVPAVVLMLAVMRAGAVACPISTRLPGASAVERCRRLEASIVVSETAERSAAAPEEFIERGRDGAEAVSLNRSASIVFTSGSTGSARPALHTYGNHYFSAAGSNENIKLTTGDRWLLSLPLYHVGGIAVLFRCLLARATVVIPSPGEPLAEAAERVTHASLVPTQLRRLLRAQHRTIHPKKAVLLGGSAIPAHLIDAALEAGLPVHTSYGMTETASQVAATQRGATRADLDTSGRVLPYRELCIDETGQILVRGRTRFEGYCDGSRLSRPFDEDGWFATGDLGRFDAEGRLAVLGRLDNLFISGGENIQPEEIEAAIASVRSVERVVVVPVDDEEFGQRPVAFVETAERGIDEHRLRAAVEAVLPRFMVPDAFHAWPADAEGQGVKADRPWLQRRARALKGLKGE